MQSIVSKGRDVNDAIELGLNLLKTTIQNVDIEILEQGSKGFLGIGSKGATVKLCLINNKDIIPSHKTTIDTYNHFEEMIESMTLTEKDSLVEQINDLKNEVVNDKKLDLEGKVWVKDGQLYCKSSPSYYPTVTIEKGISLFKNNQLVKESTTIISENDLVEIKIEQEEKEMMWNIIVDHHFLKVTLEIEPGYKTIRSIPNSEPDKHIILTPEERREVFNNLTYSEVSQKLDSLGVTQGINEDMILKALESTESATFEIASAIKPSEGRDGLIELMVETNTMVGPKENGDGSVNYREIRNIPAIERGTVLAEIHPPIPGVPGLTVTNDAILPKHTNPITLNLGKGVVNVEGKIVATESGRPYFEKRGLLVKISIMPKLTHYGNVDLSSGNIRFLGDVDILGTVEERMTVEADGDIFVQNSVNMSTLTASGAIMIYGNIVGSEVSAGKNNMLITELGHLTGILHKEVEKIISIVKQLTLSPAFKANDFSRGGLQPLIRILMEKKFQSFPSLAQKFVDISKRGEKYLQDDEWRHVSTSLTHLFLSINNEVISIDRIEALSKQMKQLYEFSTTPVEPDSYITISKAMNSSLYSSGNIFVLGQGCVNTKIHAGGNLMISGTVRGGEVYGRLGVEINEVGAASGTSTIIAVPHDKNIRIKKAMEGTILKIGNIKHTLKETKYNLVAEIDKNNRIIFS